MEKRNLESCSEYQELGLEIGLAIDTPNKHNHAREIYLKSFVSSAYLSDIAKLSI